MQALGIWELRRAWLFLTSGLVEIELGAGESPLIAPRCRQVQETEPMAARGERIKLSVFEEETKKKHTERGIY